MRVFVVGTGRCGTRTFAMACKHIRNYTSGHETHTRQSIGDLRYPDHHIEVDSHLTWALPLLVKKYPPGPNTIYVHLLRDREACVDSHSRRQKMDLFANIACFVPCSKHTPDKRRRAAEHFYDSLNAIADMAFCKEPISSGYHAQKYVLTCFVESLSEAWPIFWKMIGAKGDYESSLAETGKKYNRGLESKGEIVRAEH